MLAGGEARGAIDALWLVSAAAALGFLTTRLGGSVRAGWIVAALFTSQPLTAALLAGMQTELPATALIAALSLAIVRHDGRAEGLGIAALIGGLFALKFGQLVAALVLIVWWIARVRPPFNAARFFMAFAIFIVVSASSYFYAWRVGGNPMLPLFNDVFRSPLMPPYQLDNAMFHAGFGITLPWRITFETPRYFEGEPGGFGFVLVALSGIWLLAIVERTTRGLALAATMIVMLPLLPMQYARYAFPGLVLLLPAMAAAGERRMDARGFAALALSVCALDVMFQPNASWSIGTVARKRLLTHFRDNDYVLTRFAPERVLIARLRALDASDAPVLAIDDRAPYVAELGRRGRTVSWYDPVLDAARAEAERDPTGARWCALFDSANARWLLLRPANLSSAQRAALASDGAHQVAAVGDAALWSWHDAAHGRLQ